MKTEAFEWHDGETLPAGPKDDLPEYEEEVLRTLLQTAERGKYAARMQAARAVGFTMVYCGR